MATQKDIENLEPEHKKGLVTPCQIFKKIITRQDLVYVTDDVNPWYFSNILASEAKDFSTEDLLKIHNKFTKAGYTPSSWNLLDFCNLTLANIKDNAVKSSGVWVLNKKVKTIILHQMHLDWQSMSHEELLQIARCCLYPNFINNGSIYGLVRHFTNAIFKLLTYEKYTNRKIKYS